MILLFLFLTVRPSSSSSFVLFNELKPINVDVLSFPPFEELRKTPHNDHWMMRDDEADGMVTVRRLTFLSFGSFFLVGAGAVAYQLY